jgi:energy-converting hydrogenase B subunit D
VTVLQLLTLGVVALLGTATVLVRVPDRQVVASGLFGLSLGVLFFVFGAPDVALSQIAVGGVAVPVMALLALTKLHDVGQDEGEEEQA